MILKNPKNLSLDQGEDWLSNIILEFIGVEFIFLSQPVICFSFCGYFFLKEKIHDELQWFIC